jgi:hypothetical protein
VDTDGHPRAPNSVHSWEAPHCCLSCTANKRLPTPHTPAKSSALIVDNHFALKSGKKIESHTGEQKQQLCRAEMRYLAEAHFILILKGTALNIVSFLFI